VPAFGMLFTLAVGVLLSGERLNFVLLSWTLYDW
jgi:hypothetical protein